MNLTENDMPTGNEADYLITVRWNFDASWSEWFSYSEITHGTDEKGRPVSIFRCTFLDQAALRGVLIRLWDLNATVISVQQISFAVEEVNHNGGLEND